jgi:hypothetical protein
MRECHGIGLHRHCPLTAAAGQQTLIALMAAACLPVAAALLTAGANMRTCMPACCMHTAQRRDTRNIVFASRALQHHCK